MKLNSRRRSGFSLVEVVVAVGIFAVVAVVVVGMLGPLARSVTEVREVDDAGRLSAVLQAGLQTEANRVNWATFAGYLNGSTVLYANKEGTKISPASNSTVWPAGTDGEKFFEIKLTRNATVSPGADDAVAGYLAFNIRLAWPAYLPDGSLVAGDALTQQNVQIIPATVIR